MTDATDKRGDMLPSGTQVLCIQEDLQQQVAQMCIAVANQLGRLAKQSYNSSAEPELSLQVELPKRTGCGERPSAAAFLGKL